MSINEIEIAKQLTAIHAALVEKTGEQPFLEPRLVIRQSGKVKIHLYRAYNDGNYDLGMATADTMEGCIAAAFDFIDKLPDPETAKKRKWHGKLANVIDEGQALNIEDDVMQPIRDGSAAMSKNLLAAE